MIRPWPVIMIASLSLVGCAGSNASVPKAYYVLGLNETPPAQQPALNGSAIALKEIELASYLEEPGIAMILADNQIANARNSLWGEGLRQTIPRILARDLAKACACPVTVSRGTNGAGKPADELSLRIDRFGPTYDGQVVLGGELRLSTPDRAGSSRQFYFAKDLSGDGYAAAVSDMRELLPELASLIVLERPAPVSGRNE